MLSDTTPAGEKGCYPVTATQWQKSKFPAWPDLTVDGKEELLITTGYRQMFQLSTWSVHDTVEGLASLFLGSGEGPDSPYGNH